MKKEEEEEEMGGGNGQKARMAREKNMEKQKAVKGINPLSTLKSFSTY